MIVLNSLFGCASLLVSVPALTVTFPSCLQQEWLLANLRFRIETVRWRRVTDGRSQGGIEQRANRMRDEFAKHRKNRAKRGKCRKREMTATWIGRHLVDVLSINVKREFLKETEKTSRLHSVIRTRQIWKEWKEKKAQIERRAIEDTTIEAHTLGK